MSCMADFDDDMRSELIAESRWLRQRQAALLRNPVCQDPDHTGCEICENDPDDEECDDA
jgi:hypothetical protein